MSLDQRSAISFQQSALSSQQSFGTQRLAALPFLYCCISAFLHFVFLLCGFVLL
jgi:hypothetical protein